MVKRGDEDDGEEKKKRKPIQSAEGLVRITYTNVYKTITQKAVCASRKR
jgi:hypothetical protein